MTIAASVPSMTYTAKSKKTALTIILSNVQIDGDYIPVWAGTLDDLRCSANRAGLYLVEKPKRPGVLGVWGGPDGDTLYGTWHKSRNEVKVFENGTRPYGN